MSTVTVEIIQAIKNLYSGDQDYDAIYKALSDPSLPLDPHLTKTQLKCYELVDGLLYL
jgi:hypothetical protein